MFGTAHKFANSHKPPKFCIFPREGVIIECPLNHLFHDACDIILTSQNDVRQLDDDDDQPTLGVYRLLLSFFQEMSTF